MIGLDNGARTEPEDKSCSANKVRSIPKMGNKRAATQPLETSSVTEKNQAINRVSVVIL